MPVDEVSGCVECKSINQQIARIDLYSRCDDHVIQRRLQDSEIKLLRLCWRARRGGACFMCRKSKETGCCVTHCFICASLHTTSHGEHMGALHGVRCTLLSTHKPQLHYTPRSGSVNRFTDLVDSFEFQRGQAW